MHNFFMLELVIHIVKRVKYVMKRALELDYVT
jgi:hypothetical protein